MSSYLIIYLEKKKEEGEEKGERLILATISRANEIYSLFYDNNIGRTIEENIHEFTSSDLDDIITELDDSISRTENTLKSMRDTLRYVSDKDAIFDMAESIGDQEAYLRDINIHKHWIEGVQILLSDVGEQWSDFNKMYWKIE